MTDIDDLLDDRMTGGTGDYPPWFDEKTEAQGEPPIQTEGDRLEGVVTHRRDDPFFDPDEEDEPKPIIHVKEAEGDEWSTRTHVNLVSLINDQEPEVGDYVRIQYEGTYKTDRGQVANDYTMGVVREEELEDLDIPTPDGGNASKTETTTETSSTDSPDEPETEYDEPMTPAEAAQAGVDPSEVEIKSEDDEPEEEEETSEAPFDPSEHNVSDIQALVTTTDDVEALEALLEAEESGKDRKTAKHAVQERLDELTEDSEEEESEDEESGEEVPGDVIEFAESLMSFHGELTFDELDEYLNETRDFDIDPERAAKALSNVEIDGETVKSTE